MMFSTKESNVDTNFQPFLWSNNELSHKIQQKISVIDSGKIFDNPSQFSLEALKNYLFKIWFTWLV